MVRLQSAREALGTRLPLLPGHGLEAVLRAQVPCAHVAVLAAAEQCIPALQERLQGYEPAHKVTCVDAPLARAA